MADVAEMLTPECFYTPAHRYIYKAFISMYNENQDIDLHTMVIHLRGRNLLAKVGGIPFLAQLTHSIASSAHLPGIFINRYPRAYAF